MSTRHRSATTSRKDAYGLWRPSDSDSDRPRQTMATSQRHNVDQGAAPESSRKHRSSRRTDPLDPAAAHSHHKSSSKDRSSTVHQSYYTVPQQQHSSTTSRAHEAVYVEALRAYLKKKTDKRSPRTSKDKVPTTEAAQTSRSAYPSRHDYATAATYAQPPASTSYYAAAPDQTTRDPTSSSRHHRDREKDRDKSSRRDVEKLSMRDYAAERNEERERRRRKEKEAGRDKERSSKDRDRHKEKERSKHRDAQADRRAPDTASLQQAYAQASAPARRSDDRLPAGYQDYGRAQQPQVSQVAPPAPTALPWTGLAAGGRRAPSQTSVPPPDAGYPSASDREDPPLPIPPPGHRRERSSSKAHRSQRHHVLAQQAAQDSGISSSEPEQSGVERARLAERRHVSREQASTLGRGQSSGPSGSENERGPTFQKERRKHKESSRHRSRSTPVEGQQSTGPTTSQEIAQAWYQQHTRDVSGTKQSAAQGDSPQRPSTAVPHDATVHSGAPHPVSIRAGQGPSEPHAGTLLPKNHSATSIHRQGNPQTVDRTYDSSSRAQPAAQYYQPSAGRTQDAMPQTASAQPYSSAYPDASRTYQHSSVNAGVTSSYQQPPPAQHPHTRHADSSGVTPALAHASHQAVLPDVVVRPPSAAPTHHDPYSSRTTVGGSVHQPDTVAGQRLQVPSHDSRARSTPAPQHAMGHSHANAVAAQPASHSHQHLSAQHPETDLYRSAPAGASSSQQYGVSDIHRITSPAPQASAHTRGTSQDPSPRFPVYEDTAGVGGPAGYGSQHTYNPPTPTAPSRSAAPAAAAYPSASPKRNLTYPGASAPAPAPAVHVNPSNYHGAPVHDGRSPKPPSMATITPEAAGSRSQAHAAHGREPSGQSVQHQPSPRYDQTAAQLAADAGYGYATGSASGYSPSRQYLADPGRSPAVGHAVSVGSAAGTPKHSPSGRLHSHRNGSNDTIAHTTQTKPSPSSGSHQQLPHRNSVINLQSHAASRPDNASVYRQPNASSGYPEPTTRYRTPAPPGYPAVQPPNGTSANYQQQAYSVQTPTTSYDYQHGRATASQTATQGYTRGAAPTDYGYRSQEPPHSAPPTSTTMPIPTQRAPPRTAPSPAPTVRPQRTPAVSSPSGKAPALHSAPPQPTRHQTYPAPAPGHPAAAASFPSAHTRTISDPQYPGKGGNPAYASASLPTRGQNSSRNTTLQTPEVLLTPSSLAPSMLPQVSPTVPLERTTSKASTKDKDQKKKGLLGRGLSLFRSRSSPPKPRDAAEPPPSAAVREKRQRNVSQPTQPAPQMQAAHVPVKPVTGAPTAPQVAVAAVSIPAPPQARRENSAGQVPLAAPTPVHAAGRRSPNGKMFTPFRLLSRRHHTVSTASVDAVDGTVINAMLTGGDSTRSSTAGRPSPPLRDPMTAAQEWRNREEYEQQVRGTVRRRRPGVTFEVNEDVHEDRTPVQRSLRANMAAMQAASAAPAPTPVRQATA
ncbi:hypothetical protein C8Q77DRAFT_1189512 [Trametes polyzona]|nr:hypothetical protein C8Q77DRAFT_1189512 [Trametes polyzona]